MRGHQGVSGYRWQWMERNLWGQSGGARLCRLGALLHPSRRLGGAPALPELQRTPRGLREPAPSRPPFPHLEGSASTEKGPLMWTAFRLFSNMP